MDYVFDILLICHLLALGVGVATAMAMPLVGRRMAGATPETRAVLGGIAARLGFNSRLAVGALVVTGVLMIWVRYGGVDGLGTWFWIKMALVAVIVLVTIVNAVALRGSVSPAILGWITRLSLLGVVIAAVFAFN